MRRGRLVAPDGFERGFGALDQLTRVVPAQNALAARFNRHSVLGSGFLRVYTLESLTPPALIHVGAERHLTAALVGPRFAASTLSSARTGELACQGGPLAGCARASFGQARACELICVRARGTARAFYIYSPCWRMYLCISSRLDR